MKRHQKPRLTLAMVQRIERVAHSANDANVDVQPGDVYYEYVEDANAVITWTADMVVWMKARRAAKKCGGSNR